MANEKLEDLKGRAKEAAGDLTNDDDLKREGKVDRGAAGVKDKGRCGGARLPRAGPTTCA
jgi:uncharacterized protein YjbJ (UPF0337 family)